MGQELHQFKQILKKKGTGRTMSKHMDQSDIEFVFSQLHSTEIPAGMKSTLLTAWIMLDSNDAESHGLETLKQNYKTLLPNDLFFIFEDHSDLLFDQTIRQLRLHQSISSKTIKDCLSQILERKIPEAKITAFFEGLRLKEETFEENASVYDFFRSKSLSIQLGIPVLIDMATPYDGFNRHYFLQPFVAALLASIGIPTILHGVHEVSPKNGMNTHKLFLEAKKDPLRRLDIVAEDILNPTIGWGYVDQRQFCPELHSLISVRFAMVKRPLLATIEKWLQPISANRTVCFTGFTHPPYKQKTIDLIHHAKIYSDLMLVRGVEGSSLLPSDRRTPFITSSNNNTAIYDFISPSDFSFSDIVFENQSPEQSLQFGLDALTGRHERLCDYLKYQCLAVGRVLGKDLQQLIHDLNTSISSGNALNHWKRLP